MSMRGAARTEKRTGHVYALVSPKTELVKIGGTDFPPMKRIKELNSSARYRELGPWHLSDFREVTDWRKVEAFLQYTFRSLLDTEIIGAKELFQVAREIVSAKLNEIDPDQIITKPKIDRMFQDAGFSTFIMRLFSFTGLLNWIDIHGASTFVLFPGTGRGRYFTINICCHEVAFSTLPEATSGKAIHAIVMDCLIYDFHDAIRWVNNHKGSVRDDPYLTGLPRWVEFFFEADFDAAASFLRLDGVRRALIAYWAEALIGLKESGVSSVFARFHNRNAIAEVRSRAIGAVLPPAVLTPP